MVTGYCSATVTETGPRTTTTPSVQCVFYVHICIPRDTQALSCLILTLNIRDKTFNFPIDLPGTTVVTRTTGTVPVIKKKNYKKIKFSLLISQVCVYHTLVEDYTVEVEV